MHYYIHCDCLKRMQCVQRMQCMQCMPRAQCAQRTQRMQRMQRMHCMQRRPENLLLHPDQIEKDRLAALEGAVVLLGGDEAERAAIGAEAANALNEWKSPRPPRVASLRNRLFGPSLKNCQSLQQKSTKVIYFSSRLISPLILCLLQNIIFFDIFDSDH